MLRVRTSLQDQGRIQGAGVLQAMLLNEVPLNPILQRRMWTVQGQGGGGRGQQREPDHDSNGACGPQD